tara:strand:+ start:576 stop:842 length:267 start_codon:yes stop_codon:yes gene_type:complete
MFYLFNQHEVLIRRFEREEKDYASKFKVDRTKYTRKLYKISENAFLATPREPPKPKLVPKGKTFKVGDIPSPKKKLLRSKQLGRSGIS